MQAGTASDTHPDNFEERLRKRAAMNANSLETTPVNPEHKHKGVIPNTPLAASLISFLLGSIFSLGFLTFAVGGFDRFWWSTYQLGFFFAAWSGFHWGEFAVAAGWNRDKCSVSSFLLENGSLYHIAHSVALAEYILTIYFKPSLKSYPYVSYIGIALTVFGQILRSTAMMHAGSNFSHNLAFRKLNDHILVTDGIYAWFRHPSYAGFFYWALGTQLVLQNPVTFIMFLVILWRFFHGRIQVEETYLIRFFGDEYNKYRSKVGTKIPFIR